MYRDVIKNRNIMYYLIGAGISQLGNILTGLGFLFMAYKLTDSGSLTTIVAIAQAMPYLLFGLIGGVVADRVPKKQLLILLDLIRIPMLVLLMVLYSLNLLVFWHLIVVSFLIQSVGCFYNPAHRAVFQMITSTENRTTANSLLDTVARGVQVLTPIFSLGLLGSGQIQFFYIIDAITYAVSIFFLMKLKFTEEHFVTRIEEQQESIFKAILSFFSWIKTVPNIRTLFIVTFIMVFMNTWVWQVGLLLQLIDSFSKAEEYYSILLGWYGVGVILINVVIPIIWKKMSLKIYLVGSIIWGIGILIIGFASHLSIYFIGVTIVAAGVPLSGLARVYLLQTLIPVDRLGRAFSLNAVLLYASNVVSLSIFGFISTFTGTNVLFVLCGSLMIVSGVLCLSSVFKSKGSRRYTVQFFE
jgi:MFS transporter, DHA3 family, macrolide efflux protein